MDHIIVDKLWGGEEIFANNDLYCGKLLTCKDGIWSSNGKYHYHIIKDETFFIVEGELCLDLEEVKTITLKKGESYRVYPYTKHRFKSITNVCSFIEVSTHDDPSDSIRVD